MNPSMNASSNSVQPTQQGASVATRAKAIWDEYVKMRAAQIAQPGAGANPSLRESLPTTGARSSSDLSWLQQNRLEIESGPGGDHDTPYCFTLPISMKERLAWTHLQRRAQAGEVAA